MQKIALAMICKDDNEAGSLRRCLNTVAKHVDGIFITGTKKPQKEIKKICKEYGAKWSWFEWVKDFSAARNFSFSQVPKEYDWILWLDCDDMLHGGETLHDAVALADSNNIKAVFARYLYQVELDEKGAIKNILIEHLRERLIKNDGSFKWVAPIHETLIEQVAVGKTDYQGFMVVHLTTAEEMINSMYRNIDILETEVMANPQDPRPIYYLAKAYFDTKEPEILYDSIGEGLDSLTMELFKDYIRKSGWAEERAQCWEYMSMVHREKGEYKKAVTCLLEALSEWPTFTSIYIQLALCYCVLKDWQKALHWAKLAGQVEIPKTTLVVSPRDYKSMLLEALFHIFLNTGKLEQCLKVATDLAELLPSDMNKQRLRDIQDLKGRNDIAHNVITIANFLKDRGQMLQLKSLVNAIPAEIVNEPIFRDLRNKILPPTQWSDDSVVIYCGPGFENWSPKSIAKGIGGSEEAVINMGRELSKLGWKVTVYGDPGVDEGEYDGVSYLPYSHVNWNDHFNILISWRQIGLFDVPNLKANKTYLWNHDLQNRLLYTKERIDKIDKVMFLSDFHRSNVPELSKEKIMLTSNGINV